MLTQSKGVPGRFEIAEEMEMICIHYPTFARAFGFTVHEYNTIVEGGDAPPEPVAEPRGQQYGGGFFDPTVMQVFAVSDMQHWIDGDVEQDSQAAYIADRP